MKEIIKSKISMRSGLNCDVGFSLMEERERERREQEGKKNERSFVISLHVCFDRSFPTIFRKTTELTRESFVFPIFFISSFVFLIRIVSFVRYTS